MRSQKLAAKRMILHRSTTSCYSPRRRGCVSWRKGRKPCVFSSPRVSRAAICTAPTWLAPCAAPTRCRMRRLRRRTHGGRRLPPDLSPVPARRHGLLARPGQRSLLRSSAAPGRRLLPQQRPDAVILIDYPGFHWWLARRAKAHGIPVFYFVPPQIWAWASWRVKKMRRFVDHVLCSLPFEEPWYRERGVAGPLPRPSLFR